MTEEQQGLPAVEGYERHQDPAEPYQTGTETETEPQPEPVSTPNPNEPQQAIRPQDQPEV